MPIRFRCEHCTQLLGIARRKSGQFVRCPTCAREIRVPVTDEPSLPADPSAPPPLPIPVPETPPGLFERDDFDALLQNNVSMARGKSGAVSTPPPAARPQPPAAPAASNSWQPNAAPAQVTPVSGVILTSGRATVLTVVVILMLAIAFAGGVLVGRFALQ